MKKLLLTLISSFIIGGLSLQAQVTISGGTTAAGSYPTLSAAISALNGGGSLTAPVVVDVNAGFTETLSGRINLTMTGDAVNTITIQKSGAGANPVLTSYTGTNLANTATFDGMFALIGSDYVTIDGIDLQEAATNTTATTTMEYGYGLFKASATDGANNNLIKNCVITLNRVNTTTTSGFPFHGSNGIIVVPCTPTAMTTAITVTATSGASSNNRFYTNTLQNLNTGISLCGFAGASPFTLCDTGNDVGGSSASTGNNIINFGGGTSAANACAAVYVQNEWSFNISYNTVDNNVGGTGGFNHTTTNRGIFTNNTSVGASANINNNNITIRGGSSTSSIDWTIDCEMAQTGANGNTININNNTLSVEKTVASTVALTAIWFNSAPTTANINNNIVTKFVTNSTSTADCGVIRCALAPATLNINNNNISGVVFNNTTGTNFIISSTSAVTSAVNINNNIIDGVSAPLATTKTLNIITRTAAANTANASINDNSFTNITRTGTGAVTFITGTGTPLNQTINNNTFNNLTINTTSTVTFISQTYTGLATCTKAVNNNSIVTQFTKSAAGGSVILVTDNGSTPSGATSNCQNNNFSNITVSGATSITGLNYTDGGTAPTRTVTGNTLSNWTGGTSTINVMNFTYWSGVSNMNSNTVSNITGQGAITGLTLGSSANNATNATVSNNVFYGLVSSGTGGTVLGITCANTSALFNIKSNTIYNLSSTGATVTGINITGATLTNVSHNKIYDLQSTNTNPNVNGVAVGVGATVNVHNNIVGDLRTPNANAANPLNGINVTGGTNVNLFYNTVHLNATSVGALFGSSAVSVSSTPNATLRNNLFVNNSIANGTGLTVAHRRSSATLTNYNAASNNNLFFAPVLYTDGTTPLLSLNAYKTTMATRDQASFFENPTFLNTTTGSGANFLHLDPAVGTQAESGAIAITGYDTDIDGDIRQGSAGYAGTGVAPDLGADEGAFTLADLTSPTISNVTLLGNACGNVNRIVSANIIDASGPPTTGTLVPRVYFKKNASAYFSAPGTLSSGTAKNGIWNFTIDYSVFGGIALNDVVEYYIIAQDIAAVPNISSFPAGAVATDVNTVSAAPVGQTYIQSAYLTGTFTVGAGGFFPTLTAAVAAYNGSCMGGPIVFQLTDALYTDTVSIRGNADASAVNTLTIYPVNAGTVISGTTLVNPTIDMNGAKFVYIDGRPGGIGGFTTGTNMVINNTSATRSAIRFINDANNNIFRYCDIQGNNTNTAAATAGVILFSTTTGQNGNDNNTITYCDVHNITGGNPVVAINSNGTTTLVAQSNDNNTISNCNIYDYFSATATTTGILVQSGNSAWNIQNNKFYQTAVRTITGTGFNKDIFINNLTGTTAGSGFVISGNNFGGDNPSGSGLYNLTGTSAHTYCSIYIAAGVGTATSVQNNTFNNISFTSASTSAAALSCITNNGGNVDIGTVTGNVIGLANTDASVSPAITYTNGSTTSGGFIPIFAAVGNNAALSTTNISNNTISGVSISSTSATNAAEFNGIGYNNGIVTISNNIIGSLATPKSIYFASGSSSSNTNNSRFVGILISASAVSSKNVTVSGNTIANMWTNYANPGAPATTGARGILVVGTMTGNLSTLISNNTIRDITTLSATTTGNPYSAAGGIAITASSMANCDVLNNTIYNVNAAGTATSGAVQVTGIFFGATTTAPANINNNNIHSLGLTANNPAALLTGMDIGSGNLTIANNLIRLGIDGSGVDITAPCTVRGITKNSATSRIYHNSIYIGGQNVGTNATNTFALVRTGTAVDDWRNNILVNNRSNGSTGGKHYAINLSATTTLTLDYNDYFGNGTGYVFGSTASTGADVAAYATGWVAGDNNSFNIDPQFINPTADATNVNLHLSSTLATIAEGTGTPIAAITTDFDGETRSGLTPTDLGADAGNFVSLYCSGTPTAPTAVINGNVATICISGTKSLGLTGYASTPGLKLQWKESAVTGGPYTNVSGGTGATTSGYTTATLTTPTYYVCEVTCLNGGATALSSEVLVDVDNPQVLSTTPATRCGTGTVDLSATLSAGATADWFAAATGGVSLATGTTFTTPSIAATTTYYVSAGKGATTANFGLANRVGATTNTGYSDIGLMFDAFSAFTLQSVSIYPIGTGGNASVTIALRNSAGTILQSATISVPTAASPGVKTLVPLNFAVPAGTGHRLVFTAATGLTGVIREVTTGYTYPYTLPGTASITSAYTGGASTAYYYYFYDWVATTGCTSARTAVTATVTTPPAFAISPNQLLCTNQTGTISVTTGSADYDSYIWSPSAGLYLDNALTQPYTGGTTTATTLYLNTGTAGSTKYTCDALKTSTGCVNSASSFVTFGLFGTATVASQPNACPGTGLIATNVSGAGTVVNEDFTSGTLPSNMTSAGNDFAIIGGQMRFTSSALSKNGGVLIENPTGLANNDFQIDFDMITTPGSGSPADGFSYSYGDDVVALPTGTGSTVVNTTVPSNSTNPENGSGTKLKLSFDAYGNGANAPGVYLMYNSPIWNQASTNTSAQGLIAYINNTAWRATTTAGKTTHVTITIDALGQVSLFLAGIPVVVDQPLPASYLTDDKTQWKHAFCARTGGEYQGHFIDNLQVRYNNYYEYSINGTSWSTTTPISASPGTYNVSARYVSAPTCVAPLGSVTIDPVSIVASTSKSTVCAGQTTTLSAAPLIFTGSTYSWESSPLGLNTFTPLGISSSSTTVTVSTSTDYRCIVDCGSGNSFTSNIVSVLANDPQIVSTTGATRCGTGTVDLMAITTAGADAKWFAQATGGVALGTGTTFTTPSISTTTDYYVAAATTGGSNQISNHGLPTVTTTTQNGGVQFNILTDVVLNSIDVYSTAVGTATVTLENNAGTVIYTSPALPVANLGLAVPQTLSLGWAISVGNGYRIKVAHTSNALGYHTGTFPIDMGNGVGSVTSGWLNTATSTLNYFVYNMNTSVGCVSARTAVTATITAPPAINVSSDVTTCSAGPSQNLTVTSTNAGYTYTWNPATGLNTTSGSSVTALPATTTTYNITATDSSSGCVTTGAVKVTINQTPVDPIIVPTVDASPCKTVTKLTGTLSSLNTFAQLGTATTTTSATAVTPYSSFYEGSRVQYLILASELTALNYVAGPINSLAFNVTALGAGTFAQTGFTIKMAHTNDAAITGAYGNTIGAFSTVYGPVTLPLPALGWNTFNFSSIFTWDGASNVLIDICHDNDINNSCAACYSSNSTVEYTATSFNSVYGRYNDNAQACGVLAASASASPTFRPNMIIGQSAPASYVWSPTTGLFTDAATTIPYTGGPAENVWARPSVNTTYTVNATGINGCPTFIPDTENADAGARFVELTGLGSTTVTSSSSCDDFGWTNYYVNGKIFFAINWAPTGTLSSLNAAAKSTTTLKVVLDAAIAQCESTIGNRISAMKRWWNVSTTPFTDPVNVRFYHDPAEVAAVLASAGGSAPVFNWFKNTTGAYNQATMVVGKNGIANGATSNLSGTTGLDQGVTYVQFDGITSFSGGTGAAQTLEQALRVSPKVYLNHVDPGTGLMGDYLKTISNFATSDPYSIAPLNANFVHVNSGATATISPSVLTINGANSIVDWVFLELRQGTSGATSVVQTKAALLQSDGDVVDVDGFSPVSFFGTPSNNYIAVRHRNHLGFRTDGAYPLTATPTVLNLTNNSVLLNGAYPLTPVTGSISAMNGGDANSDGSIDSIDSIDWETQNGLFDDYLLNADYNLDGSVDSIDSIIWESNNGKYQELD